MTDNPSIILDADSDPEETLQTLIDIEDAEEFDLIGEQLAHISNLWLTAKKYRDGKKTGH
jgi:hypothetical protein